MKMLPSLLGSGTDQRFCKRWCNFGFQRVSRLS